MCSNLISRDPDIFFPERAVRSHEKAGKYRENRFKLLEMPTPSRDSS